MSGPPRIPFPFAAIYRAAFTALRDGALTVTEWRVVVCLYERASRRTWTVKLRDLDALVWLTCWEGERATLGTVLRSLRSKGWISYESRPGSTRHPYEITLLYRMLGCSEDDPSWNAGNEQGSDSPGARTDPSRASVDPSSGEAASPHGDNGSAAPLPEPIRAAREPFEKRNPPRGSLDHARAVDGSRSEAEEAKFDRWWQETRTSGPGWA